MSTYAYCQHCAGPLGNPSLSDAVIGAITCPHCDEEQAYILDGYLRRLVLHEVTEELMNLRQEVDKAGPTLTLRDQLAMAALTGLLSHASGEDPHKCPDMAYVLADAMLMVREVSND